MSGRYAKARSFKALAMALTGLFFVTLVAFQQNTQTPAIAAWNSGNTINYSATLDGSDDYFYANDGQGLPATPGSFTLEVSVNPSSHVNYNHIFDQSALGETTFDLTESVFYLKLDESGQVLFNINGPQGSVGPELGSTATLDTGSWSNIAITYDHDSGLLDLYVNGVQQDIGDAGTGKSFSYTITGGFGSNVTIGSYYYVSNGTPTNNHFFDGQIDQVKIWGSALSLDELLESNQAWGEDFGTSPITTDGDLKALYDFNEGSGTTLHNRIADSGHLTAFGSPDLTTKVDGELLIDPTRSVTLAVASPVTGEDNPITGTLEAASSTADYFLKLEGEAGTFTVGNLSGAEAQDTDVSGTVDTGDYQATKNVTLKGTVAELQAALDATTFSPSADGSSKIFASLTPVLDSTNLGSYKQSPITGHLYRLDTTPGDRDTRVTAAAGETILGSMGYLSNITSAAENSYLAVTYPWVTESTDNILIGASETGTSPDVVWTWDSGPEAGIVIFTGDANIKGENTPYTGVYATDGYTPGPGYSAFKTTEVSGQTAWNEPNDNTTGGFDCAYTNWGVSGQWDDGGCGGSFARAFYEFGGQTGEAGAAITTVTSSAPTLAGQVSGLVADQRLIDSDSDSDSVSLSWTAVTHFPAVTKYKVEYSTDETFPGTPDFVEPVTNSATVTSLTDGATYFFRVSAYNSVGYGTPSATVTSRPISNLDYALDFDGSFSVTSDAQVVPAANNAEFTVEAWVNADSVSTGYNAIYAQGQSDGTDERFWMGFTRSGSEYQFHIGRDNDGSTTVPMPDPRNRWLHVAVTVSTSDRIELYLDGQFHRAIADGNTNNAGTEPGVGIGVDNDGVTNKFDGRIDQVKVWDAALDATEVALSMNAWGKPSAGVDNNLIAHWDFNNFTNASVLEDVHANYDLTIAAGVVEDYDALASAIKDQPGKTIYKFDRTYLTETGGWTAPAGVTEVRSLVIAGGGGGGADEGGGGGAGGFIETATHDISAATGYPVLPVLVGQGGLGGISLTASTYSRLSQDGQGSSFAGVSALGGGGGGDATTSGTIYNGHDGGSGGGGGGEGKSGAAGSGTSPQGNDGAQGSGSSKGAGGGGGGAGEAASGRAGGTGAVSNILGDNNYYAAGGSGGYGNSQSGVQASTNGIGGAGGSKYGGGTEGVANTGSGGGGGSPSEFIAENATAGSNGGSGVVILSYDSIDPPSISNPEAAAVLFGQKATFSTTATSTGGTLSYQWQQSSGTTDADYSDVPGATSASLDVILSSDNKDHYYKVKVTNSAGSASETVTSTAARLTQIGETKGTGICQQGVTSNTGVSVLQQGTNCIVVFTDATSSNSWTVPAAAANAKVLVVAGGGGGGGGPYRAADDNHVNGGGGGAGGFIETTQTLSAGEKISLQVGGGGDGLVRTGVNTTSAPTKGANSTFGSLTATGGGTGGYMPVIGSIIAATSGGSGGGGGAQSGSQYPISGATGTALQGNSGGSGYNWNGSYQGSGGGGGAGTAGISADVSSRKSGDGGAGKATTVFDASQAASLGLFTGSTERVVSGSSVYLAAGGGGAQRLVTGDPAAGLGGLGGGGNGGLFSSSNPPQAALANTGAGGGGGTGAGADGASGLIAISYDAGMTLASISPSRGISSSEVSVTISGTGLAFGATAALTRTVAGTPQTVNLTNVVWVSSTEITATVPSPIDEGSWDLLVTNPGDISATLADAYSVTGNFNVAFDEIDFDEDKINSSLSIGTGKAQGDCQFYENVSTKDGVTIDGLVITKQITSGVTISEYEDGARAGGGNSFFLVDINVSKSAGSGYAVFEFKFYLAGTYAKGSTCATPASGTQVTLENVNVTGIDIDAEQYNIFTSMDSYTLASNTRLSKTITKEAAPADFPATGKFYATGDVGSNDPRDQVISTYGEIETFEVTVGAATKGTAYFGVAFKALDWGDSEPETVGQEFDLSYNANSGSGSVPADASGGVGANITVASNTGELVRDGHVFAGWNTKADGTGTTYAIGSKFLMPQGGATLYAKWDQSQYALNYSANGGTGAPAGASYDAGATVTVSSTQPTRDGFNFAGWNTAANGSGETRTAGATFTMPAASQTLYAQWTAIVYTISYNEGAGTAAGDPAEQTGIRAASLTVRDNQYVDSIDSETGAVTLATAYSRSGYTFAGWNTASNGSGVDYAVGQTLVVGQADITLYAQWTPVLYFLNYHANGGSGAPTSTSHISGDSVTLPTSGSSPVRPGYDFAGWNLQSDGNGTNYSAGASYTMPTGNTTLYAKWTEANFKVTYVAGSETGVSGLPPEEAGKTAGTEITVGAAPTGSPDELRFAGWSDGTLTYMPGEKFFMPGDDLTLTPTWVASSIQVIYNANGGAGAPAAEEVTSSAYTVSSSEPNRTGYEFLGWTVSGSTDPTPTVYKFGSDAQLMDLASVNGASDGRVTLVAKWSIRSYTITYNSQGGGTAPTDTAKTFSAAVTVGTSVAKEGFDFLGWKTTIGGNQYLYVPGNTLLMPAQNLVFTAVWDARPYTLSYSANGGSFTDAAGCTTPVDDVRIVGSVQPISTGCPDRDGYLFADWNTAADGNGQSYSPAQLLTMPAENVTLYAMWTVVNYDVTFNVNGGTDGPSSLDGDFGTTVTIPSTPPSYTGYVFSSWNTNCDGSGVDYAPGDELLIGAADVALCAVWIGTDNSLIYNPNGGSGGPGTSLVKTGATVTVSSTEPSRAGYSFSSWNTEAEGTGTAYAIGATFEMPSAEKELYAIWIGNPYTVYFNANGGLGSNLPDSIATKAGNTVEITGAEPTRTGYTFSGWYSNPLGSGTAYSGSITMPAEDLILYAKWTAISYDLVYDLNGATAGTAIAADSGILDQVMTIATAPGDLAKDGHWFAGWSTQADGAGTNYGEGQSLWMPLGGETLYAIWVENTYQVSYSANGGTGGPAGYFAASGSYAVLDEGDLAREGYTFEAWSTSPDGSGDLYSIDGDDVSVFTNHTLSGNTTFYAQWIPATYTLTYDKNTGTGTEPGVVTLTYRDEPLGETQVDDGSQLNKSFATFVGWNTMANGQGVSYSAGSTFVTPTANTVLYAQWADIYFVVEFDPLGGQGEPDPIYGKNSDPVVIPEEVPSKTGYNFSGWEKPSTSGLLDAGDSLTISGSNLKLFATYTAIQSNGGGVPPVVTPTPPVVTPPVVTPPVVTPPTTPTSPTPAPSGRPSRPTQTVTPSPSPVATPEPTSRPTETQVASPPRVTEPTFGDGLSNWLSVPAAPADGQPVDSGQAAGGEVLFDTGNRVQFTDTGALDLTTVKNVTPSQLADEKISGFAPNTGLYIEVLGSRTGARFVVTTANIIDSVTLIEAIRNSIPAQAADFFEVKSAVLGVKPTKPAEWSEKELLTALDYFEAAGLDSPQSLADIDFTGISNWIEIYGTAKGYVPGSTVFLTLTSSPLVIAQGQVDRDGNIELVGSLPVEFLEAGEHRIRLVGIRSLGGVSVDENGEVVISAETMAEIERFDLGTQSTVRMGGKTPEGDYLNAIRVVPLNPVAPWWTLWFILASFIVTTVARRRGWMNSTRKLWLGASLNLGAAVPAVVIGWLSTVTTVVWVGLALGLLAMAVSMVIQPSRETETQDA